MTKKKFTGRKKKIIESANRAPVEKIKEGAERLFKGRRKKRLSSAEEIPPPKIEIDVGPNPIWEAQAGTQSMFLSCPFYEILLAGTRGNGKTDALLMDFVQHIGLGPSWRGILFRRTYKQLVDVVAKTQKFFPRMFPGAKLNKTDMIWKWPSGEELLLRYMRTANDYWNYHGHEYPWIGWEELTNWPTDECYEAMKTCCRSSEPDMPRKYRATTNPYGPGHAWVKSYFVDPAPAGGIIYSDSGMKRIRLQGHIRENEILLKSDPYYVSKLKDISDPNKKKAWLEGSWDIVAGGAISDLWDEKVHVIRPFKIPHSWRIDRSFDWGSSKPFSVSFWAESDGSMIVDAFGNRKTFPKGTLFRIGEYYGYSGRANDGLRLPAKKIAQKILEKQKSLGYDVSPGPADPSIWDSSRGASIADKMKSWEQNGRRVQGVTWTKGDNSPGSRVNGLEVFRDMLDNSLDVKKELPMQGPGFFAFEGRNKHFLRLMPTIPRDEQNMDDVDTETEDHIWDDCRYRILNAPMKVSYNSLWG